METTPTSSAQVGIPDPEVSRDVPHNPADNPFIKALRKHEDARTEVIRAARDVIRHKEDGPRLCHVPRAQMDSLRRAFQGLSGSIDELKNLHKNLPQPPAAEAPPSNGNTNNSVPSPVAGESQQAGQ